MTSLAVSSAGPFGTISTVAADRKARRDGGRTAHTRACRTARTGCGQGLSPFGEWGRIAVAVEKHRCARPHSELKPQSSAARANPQEPMSRRGESPNEPKTDFKSSTCRAWNEPACSRSQVSGNALSLNASSAPCWSGLGSRHDPNYPKEVSHFRDQEFISATTTPPGNLGCTTTMTSSSGYRFGWYGRGIQIRVRKPAFSTSSDEIVLARGVSSLIRSTNKSDSSSR